VKGNIQQRGPKTWRLRYDVPSPEGRRQVSETVRGNKRDAQRTLRERLAAIDKGIYIERTDQTVSEYLEHWLEAHSANISIRTRVGYMTCIKRFGRYLGTVTLQKLRPGHIQSAYKDMLDSGLSPRTVLHGHRVLSQALKDAVKWGLRPPQPRCRRYAAQATAQGNRRLGFGRCQRVHGSSSGFSLPRRLQPRCSYRHAAFRTRRTQVG